jgi:hypothetical protein
MFLPASMEWQAWHFLKTRRPAAASPAVWMAFGVVAAFAAGGGAGGGAGDCPVVALGDGLLLAAMCSAAMWSCAGADGEAGGAAAALATGLGEGDGGGVS